MRRIFIAFMFAVLSLQGVTARETLYLNYVSSKYDDGRVITKRTYAPSQLVVDNSTICWIDNGKYFLYNIKSQKSTSDGGCYKWIYHCTDDISNIPATITINYDKNYKVIISINGRRITLSE